jgi:hypothetical protein
MLTENFCIRIDTAWVVGPAERINHPGAEGLPLLQGWVAKFG